MICLAVCLPVCLFFSLSICLFAEEAIQNFMGCYRRVFPEVSVTVKLHIHVRMWRNTYVVPFLKKWKGIGFGLMADRGAKSIHHKFNDLTRTSSLVPT